MKIDSLKTTPDRAGRYWAAFEDGTRLGLYRQTVEDFGLYAGKELTKEETDALLTAAGQMSAKMRAVRIVSASNVSRKDLEQRLVRKGEDPDQAKQAVRWMEDMGLVDDRNTAEQVVQSCIRKGYGLARARQVLFQKKIPRQLWDQVLEDYPEQQDKLMDFLRSRLGEDCDEKQKAKAINALLRRGHSYAAIRRAMDELAMEAPDEEF